MIVWLLSGCMHTPSHPGLPERVAVRLAEAHAVADDEGRDCSWEEEGLWLGESRVFGNDPPDAANWCTAPSQHWATVDLLGQDGRFVSVLMERDDGASSCVTWDVSTRLPATLVDYDEKLANKRLKIAERRRARANLVGALMPDNFYVRGGHVVFCSFDGQHTRSDLEVP